jgi:transcription elongation factor S-II
MTAQEMAGDELKEMKKNLTKEAIREHQMAKNGELTLTCSHVASVKRRIHLHTGSADEPMRTLVVCKGTGSR